MCNGLTERFSLIWFNVIVFIVQQKLAQILFPPRGGKEMIK